MNVALLKAHVDHASPFSGNMQSFELFQFPKLDDLRIFKHIYKQNGILCENNKILCWFDLIFNLNRFKIKKHFFLNQILFNF
jgi:hypothetical protein